MRVVSQRRSDAQRPRAERTPSGAWAEHSPDADIAGDRRSVHRPSAAEGQQRELTRVDAALDRDHAQGADHLLVRDPDDPLRRLELAEAE